MADRITAEERRLIDEHLARRGARRIPAGVGTADEPVGFREMFARDHRLNEARRKRARRLARLARATR